MDDLSKFILQIGELARTDRYDELLKLHTENQESIESIEKKWFDRDPQGADADIDSSDSYHDLYLENIVSYISDAVDIHVEAIPHNELLKISLYFSTEVQNQHPVEPYIQLQFDNGTYDIDISELWCSSLKLDREKKNACVSSAELFWPEYRCSVSTEQLVLDAEAIRKALEKKYQNVDIICEFDIK